MYDVNILHDIVDSNDSIAFNKIFFSQFFSDDPKEGMVGHFEHRNVSQRGFVEVQDDILVQGGVHMA